MYKGIFAQMCVLTKTLSPDIRFLITVFGLIINFDVLNIALAIVWNQVPHSFTMRQPFE